jgi:hypothetical protein
MTEAVLRKQDRIDGPISERDFSIRIASLMAIDDGDKNEPTFLREFRQAQLLQLEGKYNDSLTLLSKAIKDVRVVKAEFLWQRSYVNICMLYAAVCDYLGNIDEAEVCKL